MLDDNSDETLVDKRSECKDCVTQVAQVSSKLNGSGISVPMEGVERIELGMEPLFLL